MTNLENKILEIHKNIKKNKGKIPEDWYLIKDLIIFSLKIVKIFTNDKIDKIIDEFILILNESFVNKQINK